MPAVSESAVVHAWTDGSVRPRNPGYGGSAYLIIGSQVWLGCKWLGANITNNQAELQAIWDCLLRLQVMSLSKPEVLPAIIHSDSEWAVNSITGIYKSHKNREYLDPIIALVASLKTVTFEWCRGHVGDPYNEFVDKVARLATLIPGHEVKQEFTREQFSLEGRKFLAQQEELSKLL